MSRMCRSSRKYAFTLVELLVVIGIIAVLISILLPSLARARAAAVQIACSANMRSVGQALMLYDMTNKKLPYLYVNVTSNGGTNGVRNWAREITQTLGVNSSISNQGNWPQVAKSLRCGAAIPAMNGDDTRAWHFVPSPRVMPWVDLDASGNPTGPKDFGGRIVARRSLSSIRNASEKVLLLEGPQWMESYSGGETVLNVGGWWDSYSGFDGWGGGWCHGFADPPLDGSNIRTRLMPIGGSGYTVTDMRTLNRDITWGNWDQVVIRYRHGMNDGTNLLYCDGHVESKKIGEIMTAEFCVNRQN